MDDVFIQRLEAAATAGVQVRLIIRSICCINTTSKSYKKNIQAVSIIDEYLEHARVFVFHNAGAPQVYISSADWMIRNLDHRVEAACPILDPKLQKELIDILDIQLAGNIKSRVLNNEQDNSYVEKKDGDLEVRSQVDIYDYLLKAAQH